MTVKTIFNKMKTCFAVNHMLGVPAWRRQDHYILYKEVTHDAVLWLFTEFFSVQHAATARFSGNGSHQHRDHYRRHEKSAGHIIPGDHHMTTLPSLPRVCIDIQPGG